MHFVVFGGDDPTIGYYQGRVSTTGQGVGGWISRWRPDLHGSLDMTTELRSMPGL